MIEHLKIEEMREAAKRLVGIAYHTPLVPLHTYGQPEDIWLKLETHQPITSFKIRGIYNAVASLTPDERARGLSTVSAGNTAQALAWVGNHFGVSSRSLMPDTAPQTKIDAVKAYGGVPVLVPMADVFRFLKEHLWDQEPFAFVHPWTNRQVMIGHASMGLEIVESLPDVDTVFVPVGGGGLIGGVASALKAIKPEIRIVAVEPIGCPSLHESLRKGKPASVDCDTICDGVAVPYMTDEVFGLVRDLVDESVLVSDEDVKTQVRQLAFGNRIIVEPSAALSVAAALAMPAKKRGRSVCVVTGGSIDLAKLTEILSES